MALHSPSQRLPVARIGRRCSACRGVAARRIPVLLVSSLWVSALLWVSTLVLAPAARAALPDQVATAPHGMVVCQQALASRAGLDVLRAGGNAVDAAVATALALAVVHPQAGNIGGGGFLLLYRAQDSLATVIDFRETAPARASRDMYLNAQGQVDTLRSLEGHWSAGVPGTLAGLHLAWAKYGRMSWRSLVVPALKLAQEGFPVNAEMAAALEGESSKLQRFPKAAAVFLPHGKPLAAGDRLVQPDLVRTLRLVAQSGALTFYEGAVADLIVEDMQRNNGPITAADLAGYRAIERPVLRGRYRDLEILTVPPPSSGGVTLLQMLALLEPFDVQRLPRRSTVHVHLVAEVMARAFADRNTYLGDPAFVRVPLLGLLSPAYIAEVRSGISLDRATPAGFVRAGDPWRFVPGAAPAPAPPPAGGGASRSGSARSAPVPSHEEDHTTHLSVVDAEGNVVSLTTTLNGGFGSGVVVPGGGFLLNNEMDDFSAKPGVPNQFQLTGSDANAIAPGKRMLSSMCPAIVLRGGRPWLVLGSPGGPRIITTVLDILLDVHDHKLGLAEAVAAPRFHDQWQPDLIWYEPDAFTDEVKSGLQAMGHTLRERSRFSSAQCIEILPDGQRLGASDPRSLGAALGY